MQPSSFPASIGDAAIVSAGSARADHSHTSDQIADFDRCVAFVCEIETAVKFGCEAHFGFPEQTNIAGFGTSSYTEIPALSVEGDIAEQSGNSVVFKRGGFFYVGCECSGTGTLTVADSYHNSFSLTFVATIDDKELLNARTPSLSSSGTPFSFTCGISQSSACSEMPNPAFIPSGSVASLKVSRNATTQGKASMDMKMIFVPVLLF